MSHLQDESLPFSFSRAVPLNWSMFDIFAYPAVTHLSGKTDLHIIRFQRIYSMPPANNIAPEDIHRNHEERLDTQPQIRSVYKQTAHTVGY